MDVLLGFLIGLFFPAMLVIVVASLVAGRAAFGVIVGVTGLIVLTGPVAWTMTFVALGFGAGLAAFVGWVLGLGIAALMVALFLVSRLRRYSSHSSSYVNG